MKNTTAIDFFFQIKTRENNSEVQYEQYLAEAQISHSSNPYKWWATHRKTYSALSILAKQYLYIPATSANFEREFSATGNIVYLKI